MANQVTLDGIIEADETFFTVLYKGNHSKSKAFEMPRKAYKRGHSTHIRGLSKAKVCVSCAVNRAGLSIARITNTGRVSTKDLHRLYDGRIESDAILVTDKLNSYVRFAKANGITLVQLKTGKAKKDIYNIQHINSYHSQLKKFMRGFNGVSTKYLNNYLAWHIVPKFINCIYSSLIFTIHETNMKRIYGIAEKFLQLIFLYTP